MYTQHVPLRQNVEEIRLGGGRCVGVMKDEELNLEEIEI